MSHRIVAASLTDSGVTKRSVTLDEAKALLSITSHQHRTVLDQEGQRRRAPGAAREPKDDRVLARAILGLRHPEEVLLVCRALVLKTKPGSVRGGGYKRYSNGTKQEAPRVCSIWHAHNRNCFFGATAASGSLSSFFFCVFGQDSSASSLQKRSDSSSTNTRSPSVSFQNGDTLHTGDSAVVLPGNSSKAYANEPVVSRFRT